MEHCYSFRSDDLVLVKCCSFCTKLSNGLGFIVPYWVRVGSEQNFIRTKSSIKLLAVQGKHDFRYDVFWFGSYVLLLEFFAEFWIHYAK